MYVYVFRIIFLVDDAWRFGQKWLIPKEEEEEEEEFYGTKDNRRSRIEHGSFFYTVLYYCYLLSTCYSIKTSVCHRLTMYPSWYQSGYIGHITRQAYVTMWQLFIEMSKHEHSNIYIRIVGEYMIQALIYIDIGEKQPCMNL